MIPHGTASGYSHHKCRCDDCRRAASLAINRWRRDKKRGIDRLVDAAAAREHLRWLSECGVGQQAVHQATGLSASHVVKIKTGKVPRVRVDTERRILSVGLGHGRPNAPVRNVRLFALVDELKRHGWSEREMARRLGYTGKSGLQLNRRTMRVTPPKAARIEALYRELMAPVHAHRLNEAQRRRMQRQRAAA